MHYMQRAAWLAHVLGRGAERGRGAAAGRERRERPCNHERQRGNARGTVRGTADSQAAARRRAGARGCGRKKEA
jgi:hypothetical protein